MCQRCANDVSRVCCTVCNKGVCEYGVSGGVAANDTVHLKEIKGVEKVKRCVKDVLYCVEM